MRYRLHFPPYFFGIFVLLLVATVAISTVRTAYASSKTPESGERLVVIHDGSDERGFLTKAGTVRDAIEDMGIILDKNDLVEPKLDEELVASSYDINIYRARPVTVVDGAVRKKIMSAYRTPVQIVKHADMELHEEDRATFDMPVGGAMQLTIDRATAVMLVLYGNKTSAYTQAKTVGEMLKQKGITLGDKDVLSLDKDTPITAGMQVELWREGKQTITEEAEVQFEIEKIQDTDRAVGFREVITPGEVGKRTVTYEVEMKNGVEVSRHEIQSVIITEPKKQVERIGTKAPPVVNPSEAAELGHQMMLSYGFGEDQWPCLYQLWMRESGWRVGAHNASSGAYGIPQALPGNKMGPGWETDAAVQINWGLGYIKGRYGTPCDAWSSFLSKGWY